MFPTYRRMRNPQFYEPDERLMPQCAAIQGLLSDQGLGLLSKTHVKFSLQGCSNMGSDWLAAVLPANEKPGLQIFLIKMDFNI